MAVIMENEQLVKGKFKELLAESNTGNDFRVFNNIDEIENWYTGLKCSGGRDNGSKTKR